MDKPMSDERLAEIRGRIEQNPLVQPWTKIAVPELVAEVDRLRAALSSADRLLLQRVWSAFGCAGNPDDFKPSVRDRMWGMVEQMAREATERNGRIYREARDADAALVRVRALHVREAAVGGMGHYCRVCRDRGADGFGVWPCATIRAFGPEA